MKVSYLFAAALIVAASTLCWSATATYIWDDFNDNYAQYPSSGGDWVEEHFSTDVWVSFAYNYEKEPGPPDEYEGSGRGLAPHTGTDACQRFRVYQQAGNMGWLSQIKIQGDGFGGYDCEVDLTKLARDKGWLPIDLTKDVTISVWVWGNNTALHPDDPRSRFWSNIYCVDNNGSPMRGGGWEAGGSWAEIDWNSSTNNSWQKLSVVLHPSNLVAGSRCGVTLINGIGPFGNSDPYFTYWLNATGTARSTTLWDNLSVTYTPQAGSIPTNIGVAKGMPDGTPVNFSGSVVTSVYPCGASDRVYVEEPDRAAGIGVVPATDSPSPVMGTEVSLTGSMATDEQTGERYIADAVLSYGAPKTVKPLAMGNPSIGGISRSPQYGANPGYGPDNTGMLVTTYGRITAYSMMESNAMYIDDGSNVAADYQWYDDRFQGWTLAGQEHGIKVYCETALYYSFGAMVSVKGIAGIGGTDPLSPPPAHSAKYRCIYVYDPDNDIRVY